MSNSKKSEIFTVDLTGLKLSDKQLEAINKAIQKAVSTEIASFDSGNKTDLLILGSLKDTIRGIIYVPKASA